MNEKLKEKIKESVSSVAPITIIVLFINGSPNGSSRPRSRCQRILLFTWRRMRKNDHAGFSWDVPPNPSGRHTDRGQQKSGTDRLITFGVLPKGRVGELLEIINQKHSYHQRGTGIAFSIPVTGLQSVFLEMLRHDMPPEVEERMRKAMQETHKKSDYYVIWTSVASRYSDDVIDAARSAGAKGGTVLKGRRRNSETVSQHLGISIQDEQDFVMIVEPRDKRADIMSAIGSSCGLRTPAHGVVVSIPVDEAIGLGD